MGIRLRLALVLLTTILGDGIPLGPPPGDGPGDQDVAVCPYCHRKHAGKAGAPFYCEEYDKWFTPGEPVEPKG